MDIYAIAVSLVAGLLRCLGEPGGMCLTRRCRADLRRFIQPAWVVDVVHRPHGRSLAVAYPPRTPVIVTTAATVMASAALGLPFFPGTRAAPGGKDIRPAAAARLRPAFVLLLCVSLVTGFGGWTLQRYPDRVADRADLLSRAEEARLARFHGLLRRNCGIDYRVVTGRNWGDIDIRAAKLYRELEIGAETRHGRGLILLIEAARDRVRIEAGYTPEPVCVGAFVAYIERRR